MADDNIRTRIVDAAGDKFLSMGFSKVTMDEVCAAVGISKRTMYQYFRSKDDLVDAVIEWLIFRVAGRVQEIMTSPEDFAGKLCDLWVMLGELLSRFSRQMQEDLRRFRPDLWKKLDETRREKILTHFKALVSEGVRLGFVRADVNKDILVYLYLGAVQATVNPEVLVQNSFSADEAVKTILRVILDGVLTDEARGEFRRRVLNQSSMRTI